MRKPAPLKNGETLIAKSVVAFFEFLARENFRLIEKILI